MSNRALAFLLIGAIVISIAGTLVSLSKLDGLSYTGYAASDNATTNFTIQNSIEINFTTANVNFGTGFVVDADAGGPATENCTLHTNGTTAVVNNTGTFTHIGSNDTQNCSGFNGNINSTGGLIVRNDGNLAVQLNLTSNTTVVDFVGGNAGIRDFRWAVSENEAGSCGSGLYPVNFSEVNTSNITACTSFDYNVGSDTLEIDFYLVIPQDAPTGSREALITAYGISS